MGNNCCSNDAIKEEGDLPTNIELKKPRSITDPKITSKNVKPAPTPYSPFTFNYQQTPETIAKWSLDDEYKKFLERFREIRTKINETIDPEKSLLSKKKWEDSFECFDKFYLTLTDRFDLTNLIYKLLKVEFCKPFSQTEIDEEFLEKIDETDMSEELGYKLKSLKERIKYRKPQALEYLQFIKEFSSYNMDFSDIKKVARRVHDFCQKDINAFSFITLYLINCTNRELNMNPGGVFETIEKIKVILNELSIEYPPSSVEREEEYEGNENKDWCGQSEAVDDDIHYETCVKYPLIKLTEDSVDNKVEEIEDYIIKKAREAKKDKITFQKILRPVCLKRGNHFQSALKIKSNKDEDILSVIRTLEKIVFKDHAEECEQELKGMKEKIIEEIELSQEYNKLGIFCGTWSESINNAQRNILRDKKAIPFNVGDLLRAKAMFKRRADISKTVKDIEKTLEKWPKDKYCILQTEDRLETPTKDFKMLLQIDGTIAELQLCKEMNKASNEFNHKIYELKRRSKAFTPLFNLTIINERLSEIFFTDLLEFLFFMIDFEEPEFINGEEQLEDFSEDYLEANVAAFSNEGAGLGAEDRLFTKDQETLKDETEQQLNEIEEMLKLGYSINGDYHERDNLRNANEHTFMK